MKKLEPMNFSIGILMIIMMTFTSFRKEKSDFLTEEAILVITLKKYDNSVDYEPLNKYEHRWKIVVDQFSEEDHQFDTNDDSYETRLVDFDNIPYKGQERIDITVSKVGPSYESNSGDGSFCNFLVSVRVTASNYCREVENVIMIFNNETLEIDKTMHTSERRLSDWGYRVELEKNE